MIQSSIETRYIHKSNSKNKTNQKIQTYAQPSERFSSSICVTQSAPEPRFASPSSTHIRAPNPQAHDRAKAKERDRSRKRGLKEKGAPLV